MQEIAGGQASRGSQNLSSRRHRQAAADVVISIRILNATYMRATPRGNPVHHSTGWNTNSPDELSREIPSRRQTPRAQAAFYYNALQVIVFSRSYSANRRTISKGGRREGKGSGRLARSLTNFAIPNITARFLLAREISDKHIVCVSHVYICHTCLYLYLSAGIDNVKTSQTLCLHDCLSITLFAISDVKARK